MGTKRPALDLGWLDALHQANVTLVSDRIARVTPSGIETADGVRREHDVIIYATGSDVPNHGLGANVGVLGEDRVELQQYWKDIGGPQSYAGLAVPKVWTMPFLVPLTTVPQLLYRNRTQQRRGVLGVHARPPDGSDRPHRSRGTCPPTSDV